ncbi:hypothetical protein B6U79_04960 [Candidatus Bathyarchaeota archaeon ex4484_231]|nr:MAG: hypothetical protein B6U79_04960 [Candidatus Bathyarchaeota archaeon ex4484_231]
MEKTSFELAPVPPYNFHLQWKFFHSPREPQPEIYCNGVWKRAFKLGNTLLPVTVTSTGTVEKPKLTVTAFSQLNAEQKKALADKITDIFRLKENLSEVYAFMEKYETLRRIKRELYGLKPPGIGATIFEGIVRVILQQQRRMEVCVPNDLGARKAVSHFYFGGKLQPGDVVRRFMERWGKFKGWVIYYLLCAYNLELHKDKTKPF